MKTVGGFLLALAAVGAQAQGMKCTTPEHCEALMVAAQRHLQVATGMKLRIASPNRLETFTASGYGRMSGVVTLTPAGDGSRELAFELYCYRGTDCADQRRSAREGFAKLIELESRMYTMRAAGPPEAAASK